MKKVIALKIDLTKVDKSKLYEGEKGLYLDVIYMYNEESDQYGQNGMIVQSVSKEDREKGIKGAILGNGKILASLSNQPNPAPVSTPAPVSATKPNEQSLDDILF